MATETLKTLVDDLEVAQKDAAEKGSMLKDAETTANSKRQAAVDANAKVLQLKERIRKLLE